MAREAFGGSNQRHKIFRDVLWLDRAEAELLEPGFGQNPLNHIRERRAWNQIAAITSQVDAAQYDLFRARCAKHADFADHGVRRQAAAAPANKRNHAI